ncbi:hypothetical protein G5V59_20025 [Nocardioides sp. W3-2-3]|uniref:hypothetical protein n=1 Tax=Nocardioides convexus TaxID=2712224 RepID=UPI0024189F80|nr:hypothetical protein [Nocardioides convexus]NHA01354.1 hypothetical protein [Nocardioides convexus]
MKNSIIRGVTLLALGTSGALGVTMSPATMPTATAGTYSESGSGTDVAGSTTLKYARAHGDLNLRLTIGHCTTSPTVNLGYTIKMYDNAGRQVWSKSLTFWTRSGSATWNYRLGGNVTKVVITRASTSGYYYTRWYTTRL